MSNNYVKLTPRPKLLTLEGLITHGYVADQETLDHIRQEVRNEVAAELEKYRDTILESRGISNPTWIGKNELQTFIGGLRK